MTTSERKGGKVFYGWWDDKDRDKRVDGQWNVRYQTHPPGR